MILCDTGVLLSPSLQAVVGATRPASLLSLHWPDGRGRITRGPALVEGGLSDQVAGAGGSSHWCSIQSGEFTFGLVLRSTSAARGARLTDARAGTAFDVALGATDDSLVARFYSGGARVMDAASLKAGSTRAWEFISVVRSRESVRFFRGTEVVEETLPAVAGTASGLTLSLCDFASEGPALSTESRLQLRSLVRCVAVWDAALTPAELAAVARAAHRLPRTAGDELYLGRTVAVEAVR